jgi:hypothetical protein
MLFLTNWELNENMPERALIDFVHIFRPGRTRSRLVDVRDWESAEWLFTPAETGTYTVSLRLQTAGIPSVHVRITDPAKRDGRRISGY